MGPLNRYGWWKRQDGATCHQDRLIRQQLIEQLGEIDLACQIGSPRAIATFLQRVGRSGHAIDGTPQGPSSWEDGHALLPRDVLELRPREGQVYLVRRPRETQEE